MPKKPIKIEIVEENGERLVCKVFEDGADRKWIEEKTDGIATVLVLGT
jgi:hypothetical protein